MMDFFALLIAFQIVFESLPVSSSGHFLLLELYLQAKGAFANLPSLPKYFDHFLHLFSVFIILKPFIICLSFQLINYRYSRNIELIKKPHIFQVHQE